MHRVLIIEDEPLVAMMLEDDLRERGLTVAGVAASVAQGLSLIREVAFDVAIVDYLLGAETSETLIAELKQRQIPFVVVTGYSAQEIPDSLDAAQIFSKPPNSELIFLAIVNLSAPRKTGQSAACRHPIDVVPTASTPAHQV